MRKKLNDLTRDQLLAIGFALLVPGILLATVLHEHVIMQVIGVVILLIASASFGAAISIDSHRKK